MSRTEAELTSRLRRMQWIATSLLALMAILFVATSLLRDAHPLLNPIWAFSEAALIGGLADWFAVTALFRHPLGLPIPHTAIVPTRKDEIGRALAGFVGRHFLTREALEVRLARVDLAERLGDWLSSERNAELLSRDAAVALDWLLRSVDSAELRDSIGGSLRDSLDHIPVNRAVATLIDVLASGNHSQALIDRLVEFGRDLLRDNQLKIRERIRDRSPWWMPRFVDEEIYDQLVGEFERILDEVGDNPVHPARIELNVRLKSLQHDLSSDPELIKKGEALRDEFLRHPATRRFFHDAWQRLRDYLLASFTDPDSAVRRGLQTQIASIGTSVAEDPEVRERLNLWLRELVVYIVENYRDSLTRIISDTIAQWDPEATGQRIELHIGKDLQFIRINGTLVGGLVGLILYAGWQVVAA
jgi:uncharacterized membrane-anchored protein YjiN (DUF445 family)